MKIGTRNDWKEIVTETIKKIAAHLDEPLSNDLFAGEASFSPFHFHRVFSGMTGETVTEMVRRLRLERAAYLLLNTEDSIAWIGMDAGYETHEAFSRTFREAFGKSPTGYRRGISRIFSLPTPNGVHWAPVSVNLDLMSLPIEGANMEIRVEERKELRVACVRHIGPYNQIGEAFERLSAWAGPLNLLGPDTVYAATYLDNPDVTPVNELRSDACISIPDDVTPTGDVTLGKLDAGWYAVGRHLGSYSGLGQAWGQLCGKEMPARGYKYREATCFEIYLSDCSTTPENELVTDIYEPIYKPE